MTKEMWFAAVLFLGVLPLVAFPPVRRRANWESVGSQPATRQVPRNALDRREFGYLPEFGNQLGTPIERGVLSVRNGPYGKWQYRSYFWAVDWLWSAILAFLWLMAVVLVYGLTVLIRLGQPRVTDQRREHSPTS